MFSPFVGSLSSLTRVQGLGVSGSTLTRLRERTMCNETKFSLSRILALGALTSEFVVGVDAHS